MIVLLAAVAVARRRVASRSRARLLYWKLYRCVTSTRAAAAAAAAAAAEVAVGSRLTEWCCNNL